jgi:hypothetical protein
MLTQCANLLIIKENNFVNFFCFVCCKYTLSLLRKYLDMKVRKQRPKKKPEDLMTIRLMVNISPKALKENWGNNKKVARKAASTFINKQKS